MNYHVNLGILRASFGCSTPRQCICHPDAQSDHRAPRSAPSSSRLYEEQNNIWTITLAVSVRERPEMCAMPRAFKQSHPNSLHPRTHSHHQAHLIKPLAGSISIVISRSRHRHGCKTTVPAPPCAQLGYFHLPSFSVRSFENQSQVAAPRRISQSLRGAIFVSHSKFHTITGRHIIGISPSGRHITKGDSETTGGVAQPMGPPISSSQFPASDVPCSSLRGRNRIHTPTYPLPQ
ncbi:hypothetical protein DFP72DRAFT_913284 [Ephemerocybe angulata]|uniref:Uncharacterized protein n=1 Tax=Ephemerocybe angulata TaxID=980116 RepID=A0A8H6HMI0_9AGAR|nr:hypothetical protein DFP72DRAFT_913284 [Tulosesus angulatus]